MPEKLVFVKLDSINDLAGIGGSVLHDDPLEGWPSQEDIDASRRVATPDYKLARFGRPRPWVHRSEQGTSTEVSPTAQPPVEPAPKP